MIAVFSPSCFQFHYFVFFSLETHVKYIMTDRCMYCLNIKK